jgi:hypothetical protein
MQAAVATRRKANGRTSGRAPDASVAAGVDHHLVSGSPDDIATLLRAHEALRRRDLRTVEACLHPDVRMHTMRDVMRGRESVLAHLSARRYEHLDVDLGDGTVVLYGDVLHLVFAVCIRWRGDDEVVDRSTTTVAVRMRDALIADMRPVPDAPSC